nr:NADH dehydrogenase subunit 2 [Dendrobaena tellermanica]
MLFLHSSFMMLVMVSLLLSTIMALSSANWVLMWAALELNLLSFIPIMMQSWSHQETEGSVKYFLAQALGSSLLLMSSMALWSPVFPFPKFMAIALATSLLLKLGSVPCHFWYPSVMASVSWSSCLILSTWQKLAPLSILAFVAPLKYSSLMMSIAGINALLGGIMGMNQTQVRTIMAYSSIGHIGWMISLIALYKPNTSIMYFMIYSMLILPIFIALNHYNIMTTKQLNKMASMTLMSLTVLLMSLGGLPPLTGFIPKLMVLSILVESMNPMSLILILGSLMNLYFYLNITVNIMFSNLPLKYSLSKSQSSMTPALLTLATLSLGLSPLVIM